VREEANTLAHYPWPLVSVACRYCSRRGQYRIESLIAIFGPEATYGEVLARLSANCTRASDRTSWSSGCRGDYFPDIAISTTGPSFFIRPL
jgi:hypothetical protein